jgi:rhamnulokinase
MPESSLNLLAFDLGAESGRAILGAFDGQRIRLTDVHRFPNTPAPLPDGLHWNVLNLWSEIRKALGLALQASGGELAGIGLDTWGVDFGLLGRDEELLGNPFCYRDERTIGVPEQLFARVPRETVFEQTGIQFMDLNTLYQLYAMRLQNAPALENAATFLMMPDLFNFWLTGRKVCEFSDVTTTQCYDPRARTWALSLLKALEIPTQMFPEIVAPGTVLGALDRRIAQEVGLENVTVVAPACHDTGSAVAAVPAQGDDYAWISSGTWSILGAEVREPVINAASLAYNFTNEGGVNDTFRLSKNLTGLWLVQECRRTWAHAGEELSYADLVALAERAPAFHALLDPDDESFLRPGDMPARMAAYCTRTGQAAPQDKGALVRAALEGLALKYRFQLERLELLLGRPVAEIHLIGGGTQNKLLSQFTANATGKRVRAGPIEATALGNALMQMLALGHIRSLAEGRQVIRQSFDVTTYEPQARDAWEEAYGRFVKLIQVSAREPLE